MNQQHEIRKLAGLDDWQLEDSDQDLRGKMLKTEDGSEIGTIVDLLADTDDKRIVGLRLADGRVVNVDTVDVRDGCPVLVIDHSHVPPAPKGVGRNDVTSEHVPIVEERMIVGKRQVELGRVTVRTRVVAEDVSESISLREEHLDIERRPTDQRIDAAQANALFQDKTVELTATGEEAVVSKQAVVTGEVVLGKHVDTRDQRIDGTVRHTEVEVERVPPADR